MIKESVNFKILFCFDILFHFPLSVYYSSDLFDFMINIVCKNLYNHIDLLKRKLLAHNQYKVSVFQLQIIIQLILSLKHMGNIISPDRFCMCGFNNRTNIYRYCILKIIYLPLEEISWCKTNILLFFNN